MPNQQDPVREALRMLLREARVVADDHHRPRYTRLDEALQSAEAALAQPAAAAGVEPVAWRGRAKSLDPADAESPWSDWRQILSSDMRLWGKRVAQWPDEFEIRPLYDRSALAGDVLKDAREQLLNTPELRDFGAGVTLEALHQRERWGSGHDAGKTPADWFWLVGYLAGKALHAQTSGNTEKALHHTISTAAALANWHGAILGTHNMRPGIDGDAALEAVAKEGAK